MTRQLEHALEERQAYRQAEVSKALDYGIAGALESQGDELLGIAIKYNPASCLLTIKAIVEGEHCVAFIGSDTMANCVLKTALEARHHRLRWRQDKYHKEQN